MTDADGVPSGWVVGVGVSADADSTEVQDLIRAALGMAGAHADHVRAVATIETRVNHPALHALPWPVVGCGAEALATVSVPVPSRRVAQAVGTASVAEAAALLVAGDGAWLAVSKQRSRHATVAVASTPRDQTSRDDMTVNSTKDADDHD